MSNFDLKGFLSENKLTRRSYALAEMETELNEFTGVKFDLIGYDKDGEVVQKRGTRASDDFTKEVAKYGSEKLFKSGKGIEYVEIYHGDNHLMTVKDGGREMVKEKDFDKLPINELQINEASEYPMEPEGGWYGDGDYKSRGGKIVYMTPDEYLSKVKPLDMDDESLENIQDLIDHINDGRTLDPVSLYSIDRNDVKASDGRHRAHASKKLGIETIPVVDFTGNINESVLNKIGIYF